MQCVYVVRGSKNTLRSPAHDMQEKMYTIVYMIYLFVPSF